ncbi:MAG: hypothetical protein IKG30_08385 [Clostridiales bacterium]|nr:hypothetical protein [Clostridiales bacterium]
MPHSSGGGSHSGGSHSSHSSSSSYHSSSGGGSSGGDIFPSNRRVSSQPFKGCSRYLYYKDNQPHFVYSNYDVRKRSMGNFIAGIIISALFFLPVVIIGIVTMCMSYEVPKRLTYFNNKKPDIVIEDNLGVFEDKKKLKDSMKQFYQETGIVPAVITVRNEDWNEDYVNLEKYAYDVYVNRFSDEAHWLIVYSSATKDNGFDDWYWEGMQGDKTDPIITGKLADRFTESLQTRLLQRSKYSVEDAIAVTFGEYSSKMMQPRLDASKLILGLLLFTIFSGLIVFVLTGPYKPGKVPEEYKNAKPCNLTKVFQEPCNFCGGIYIIGMHTTCPHCGAALPAHHYIKDEQGNVVELMT